MVLFIVGGRVETAYVISTTCSGVSTTCSVVSTTCSVISTGGRNPSHLRFLTSVRNDRSRTAPTPRNSA
jgi:hypothetical protein